MHYQDFIDACSDEWKGYTEHVFLQELAQGTLNTQCFLHYLKQDFLFLKQYARAYALAMYKAKTLYDMRQALPAVQAILDSEMCHHINYCKNWDISEKDMESAEEDFGTVAYTRYVLDSGMSGDLVELYTALAPCSIGYAEIGKRLIEAPDTVFESNPFASWVELYGGDEFQSNVKQGADYFNSLLAEIDIDSQRGQNLISVFRIATRMEISFWQQALDVTATPQDILK